MKATWKRKKKLQFLSRLVLPLKGGSKSKSIPIASHVKIADFSQLNNMFSAWYEKLVSGVTHHMTTWIGFSPPTTLSGMIC